MILFKKYFLGVRMITFSEWLKVRNQGLDRDSWPAHMAWKDLVKRQSRFTKDAEEEAIGNLHRDEARERTEKILSILPDLQREILKLRWGIGGIGPLTQSQVGNMLGITGGRVGQLEARALRELQYRNNVTLT